MSCNVHGLSEKVKRTKIFRYIRENEVQIACLQEVQSSKSRMRIWKNEFRGRIFCSHGMTSANGVAIIISKELDIKNVKVDSDKQGRKVSVSFKLYEQNYKIINIYVPNEPNVDNQNFFVNVLSEANESEADHVLLTGNFNQILDTELDRKGGKIEVKLTKAAEVIKNFMQEANWCDVMENV